jgi:tetratricopeptide (TPR) repeat protein
MMQPGFMSSKKIVFFVKTTLFSFLLFACCFSEEKPSKCHVKGKNVGDFISITVEPSFQKSKTQKVFFYSQCCCADGKSLATVQFYQYDGAVLKILFTTKMIGITIDTTSHNDYYDIGITQDYAHPEYWYEFNGKQYKPVDADTSYVENAGFLIDSLSLIEKLKANLANANSTSSIQDCHTAVLKSYNIKKLDVTCAVNIVKDSIWKSEPVTDKNISQYNDLGYFLQQAGKYTEAIILLDRVLKYNPTRTVAYFNLGDAYIGLNDTIKAKTAYRKYSELMKKDGKAVKIPKRVTEALK